MTDIITALYHAASSEEPDGPQPVRLLPAHRGGQPGPARPCGRGGRRGGRGQLWGSYGVPGLRERLQAGPGAVYGGDLMDKEERRQRVEKFRQEREREAQLDALRQIRDNPQATTGERLEAVKLIMELKEREQHG